MRKKATTENCLNCGTPIQGAFCHACGQAHLDHRESFLHVVKHFFEDLTHYEGKLWLTLKPLLLQPGRLTIEYLAGKRVKYFHPIRLFIFLNFLFFFVFFLGSNEKRTLTLNDDSKLGGVADTADVRQVKVLLDSIKKGNSSINFSLGHRSVSEKYKTVEEFERLQQALPEKQRESFFASQIIKREIIFNDAFRNNPEGLVNQMHENARHNLPKLNFIFLVFTTLLMYLLYFRHRYFLVDHAIFALHLSATFLVLTLAVFLLWDLPVIGHYASVAVFLYGNYFFYRSLRNVYQQSRRKTIFKFVMLNTFLFVFMAATFLVNYALSLLLIQPKT